jgi:asparagine synthase (glutamine-hydrolysing)
MCGITGILKFDPRAGVEERRLLAMRESLLHRGPDGAGVMVSGPVGLAHRRLSIIDVAGGHQPMSNPVGKIWITYNGELYNFRELRELLVYQGCTFRTKSDTEVVLRAYEVFGESCVQRLRGMFAFAIWDGPKQRLFLARDRLGIKPLYYSIDETELLFGSEIKALLAGRASPPVFNRAVLPEYLASRYVAGDATFFEGVRKLMPGHTLSWSATEGVQTRRYWQPPVPKADSSKTYHDHVEEVRGRLDDAVRVHLVSDVPVGVFLSGGLDSTIIAALMAARVDGQVDTFCVGFHEAAANESRYARLAAKAIRARHHEVLVSPLQFFDALPKLIWHEDEPIAFPSSVPLNIVSSQAREHVKVVLTGEGADELFLGYDYRYRVTEKNLRLGKWFGRSAPASLRAAVAKAVPKLPWQLRRYAERTFLALENHPRSMFFENFSVFRNVHRQALLLDPSLEADRETYAQGLGYYAAGGADSLACMSHTDLQTYLVELLMKQDQMSMAASLESRVPFLDHVLVDQVAAIPGPLRMRGGVTKSLLRDAVRDIVPPEIMKRRKMGFPVPIGNWLRGSFWWMVEEFVLSERAHRRGYFNSAELGALAGEHQTGRIDHSERLWLLINLEIWQRIFIDGEDPARIFVDRMQSYSQRADAGLQLPSIAMQ